MAWCGFAGPCIYWTASTTGGEVAVNLGVSRQPWVLKDTMGRLPAVLQELRAALVRVPPASSQAGGSPVLSQVRQFGTTVFGLSAVVWGTGSAAARGTFCRLFLYILERAHGEEIWDDFTMGQIGHWTGDMRNIAQCLTAMQGSEARRRFGMSPLRIVREACVWGMVRREDRPSLAEKTPLAVLNAVTGFEPSSAPSSSPHLCSPQPGEWVLDLAREDRRKMRQCPSAPMCILYCTLPYRAAGAVRRPGGPSRCRVSSCVWRVSDERAMFAGHGLHCEGSFELPGTVRGHGGEGVMGCRFSGFSV
jgi:hypothetical protein